MSKSKKNVIAPETIIAEYGADTIRWFMLSDTPPERDIEWTDAGAEGCWRFVQRVWRMAGEAEGLPAPGTPVSGDDEASKALRQASHKAIAAVTEHLEHLRFNSAVAQLYTLANAIGGADKADPAARREALEALVLLSAPMMPHLAESCWQALGHTNWWRKRPGPNMIRPDGVGQRHHRHSGQRQAPRRDQHGQGCRQQDRRSRRAGRGRRYPRPGRQGAQESDCRAQPHRQYCRMKKLAAIALCVLLAGCGFHPMYGNSLAPQLSSIYVEPIAERDGYELRNTLIDLLQSDGDRRARPIASRSP